MARSVPEWCGKTDDTAAPPRVRLRVFDRCQGRCGICDRKIRPGEGWTLEHVIALINGGKNAESNLDVTCNWCLPAKNAEDVAEKAKTAAIRSKHLGIRPAAQMRSAGFPARAKQNSATRPIIHKSERTAN